MKVNVEDSLKAQDETITSFVLKQVEGNDVLATSNKMPDDDFNQPALREKLLPPPFDPNKLSYLAESSSILNQCVDTMEINCESFGFELQPSVDEETFNELYEMQEAALGRTGEKARKFRRTLARRGKDEKDTEIDAEFRRVTNFFKYINRSMSYAELRKRRRRDYELTGNAYWEVLRNQLTQEITGMEWLPSNSMRIGRMDKRFTDYLSKKKINDTEIESVPDKRKFRRFAQIKEQGSKPIWFKEFQDPRIMDADTGGRAIVERNKDTGKITKVTPEPDSDFPFDVDKFTKGQMRLATEVIHFCCYKSPRALPYGVPRWIGALIAVMGGRMAEETNLLYFDNKTVPPGMLLVSGGNLSKGTVDRITNHIKENIRGQKNFHSILVVEAQSKQHPNLPNQGQPVLEFVKLNDAQHKDALFQNYEGNNIDKVISTFRFWGGFVGRTKEINRATAQVAMELSEQQVFAPERQDYDSTINRSLMVEMGINYWEHKSLGPQLSTPKDMADILKAVGPYITGAEGREISGKIYGKQFEELDEDWTKKPAPIVLQEIAKGIQALAGEQQNGPGALKNGKQPSEGKQGKPSDITLPGTKQEVEKFVHQMIAVRKALVAEEERLADQVVHGQQPQAGE